MSQSKQQSMLDALATRYGCIICNHEVYADRHLGNHLLDIHHAPVLGRVPLSCTYGRTVTWWHHRDAQSYFVDFIYPDGRRECLLVRSDGAREDWSARRKEAERLSYATAVNYNAATAR